MVEGFHYKSTSMKFEYMLHPEGFLLESAPFGDGFFWRHDIPVLGSGGCGEVARCAAAAQSNDVDAKLASQDNVT